MDAAQALADLTEISSQVVDVAIVADGEVRASTLEDGAAARFADGIARLLREADALREAGGLPPVAQLEAATVEGSVFVVRGEGLVIGATTRPDPTVGLVFYDLKHCLRSLAEDPSGGRSKRGRRGAGGRRQADAAA